MAPGTVPLGCLGNLSADQDDRLRQLWGLVLHLGDVPSLDQLIQVNCADRNGGESSPPSRRNSRILRIDSIILTRRNSTASLSSYSAPFLQALRDVGMTPSEVRSVGKLLARLTPDEVRSGILIAVKQESPDVWLLRYLRGCKWDVSRAFIQLLGALVWRMKEMHVDDYLLPRGELYALRFSRSTHHQAEGSRQFLAQMRMGKCYIHGVDRLNRPVCVVRVRLHRPGEQTDEVLNQFITHIIESVRLLIVPPVETSTVIFDMTGFTLANMEYSPVRFIIRCFEKYYPESLGVLLIHNAPRVFAGIWKVIKGWMDPELVKKVHFTRSVDDIERFIPRDQIVRELGGDEEWDYEYVEPEMDENQMMEEYSSRDALLAKRQILGDDFFAATSEWIAAAMANDALEVDTARSRRSDIMVQLRDNYWQLDPYVRARNYLDRTEVIQDDGRIETDRSSSPYPQLHTQLETAKVLQVAHVGRARVKIINI